MMRVISELSPVLGLYPMLYKYFPESGTVPSLEMRPRRLKKILASSKLVFPAMIPQKQGTSQFIGSFISGCIASHTWVGSNVASGVGVMVGEGVSDGKLTVSVGVRTEVGIVGMVAEDTCVGCLVGVLVAAGAGPHAVRRMSDKRMSCV
jgi:hypothetical protein